MSELRGLLLLVVPYPDEVAGRGCGVPGDVEPAGAGQELVGLFTTAQEVDEALELPRVAGADIGGLAETMLGVFDATNESVDFIAAEAGVDDDGATDGLAGGLQKHQTAIGQIGDNLKRGLIVRVLLEVQELAQHKVGGEANVIHHTRLSNGP